LALLANEGVAYLYPFFTTYRGDPLQIANRLHFSDKHTPMRYGVIRLNPLWSAGLTKPLTHPTRFDSKSMPKPNLGINSTLPKTGRGIAPMLDAEVISSLQNARIKNLVKLRNRRPRDRQKVFIAEGYRAISRALEKGSVPEEVYFSPDWFLGENEPTLLAEAKEKGATLFELTKIAFEKVAYRDRPEGILAVFNHWSHYLDELKLSNPPFLLIAESIEKPGNLGTILRSADAAGVDAVICCDPVTDLFNPNVVRSSTGVLFSMPTVMTSSLETIKWLTKNGIQAVATTPHTQTYHTEVDMTGPIAIVMGSEQFGLSETWLNACQKQARIPMAGQADSLNVAMATLVTLFEAVRQRNLAS